MNKNRDSDFYLCVAWGLIVISLITFVCMLRFAITTCAG